jgi:hypothetical protein
VGTHCSSEQLGVNRRGRRCREEEQAMEGSSRRQSVEEKTEKERRRGEKRHGFESEKTAFVFAFTEKQERKENLIFLRKPAC